MAVMKRRIAFISLIALLSALPVAGQVSKRLSREAIDSLKNKRPLDGGSGYLLFDEYAHDMGTIYESDTVQAVSFAFENVSNEVVEITDIVTNCGCASSFCNKKRLSPGEKGTVTVMFNPHSRSGTVDTNAFVYTSLSSVHPVAKLTLLGNVIDRNEWRHLPCIMGSLRLKSKEACFEQVRSGTAPQVRIACANVGTSPLRLFSRMLPPYAAFVTEPAELAPGEEGDLVITVKGSLLPEDGADSFEILVEGVEGRISDRIIKVRLK